MSGVVLESFVRKLQGKPLQVDEQVRAYQRWGDALKAREAPCATEPPAARGLQAPGPALTIAEIWARRASLKDTRVTARGKAKRTLDGILCRNFVHLRDGTGTPGKDDDLTVTTTDRVQVGDDVVATGTLRVDRDFGAGFNYPLVLEGAHVAR